MHRNHHPPLVWMTNVFLNTCAIHACQDVQYSTQLPSPYDHPSPRLILIRMLELCKALKVKAIDNLFIRLLSTSLISTLPYWIYLISLRHLELIPIRYLTPMLSVSKLASQSIVGCAIPPFSLVELDSPLGQAALASHWPHCLFYAFTTLPLFLPTLYRIFSEQTTEFP